MRAFQTLPPVLLMALSILPAGATALAQPALADLDLRVTADDIRPQVQIRNYENRTVEQYSVNGNTYMLKITPSAGAPYYLVDSDGSGDMTWSRNRPNLSVPQWTLLSW